MNSVISLGLDTRWREWVARRATVRPEARVLDAYCGTGLVALAAARHGARVTLADISPGMLEVARGRMRAAGFPASFALTDLAEDALALPGAPFDAIAVSFGLRYMDDPTASLRRLAAMLALGGRLVVLEFAPPGDRGHLRPLDRIAEWYFFNGLPRIAAALVGDSSLYGYLTRSTRAVQSPERIMGWLEEASLRVSESRTMGFGLVHGAVAIAD